MIRIYRKSVIIHEVLFFQIRIHCICKCILRMLIIHRTRNNIWKIFCWFHCFFFAVGSVRNFMKLFSICTISKNTHSHTERTYKAHLIRFKNVYVNVWLFFLFLHFIAFYENKHFVQTTNVTDKKQLQIFKKKWKKLELRINFNRCSYCDTIFNFFFLFILCFSQLSWICTLCEKTLL